MKGRLEKEPRDVIPRWRTFETTARSDRELSSTRVAERPTVDESSDEDFETALRDFEEGDSVWEAGDLLLMAISRKDEETSQRVAAKVLEHKDEASPFLLDVANQVFQPTSVHEIELDSRAEIAKSRKMVSAFPRNAVAWSDLALFHTLSGNFTQAERAIRTSLHLAPNNRFVLRSAARFYIHREDLERAHNILARADATPYDPWLLAAEIATARSAGISSRFMKRAHNVLEGRNFQQHHLSELASAVGTTEGDSPTARRLAIRRLISQSLIDPTENSVAQAQWHSTNTGFAPAFDKDPDSRELLRTRTVYEAQAWQAYIEGDFGTALDQARKWFEDQPFSARPAFLVSQIASVIMNQPTTSIEIAKRALTPNPKENVLWNNLAYAHAMLGQIEDANRALAHIDETDLSMMEKLYVNATRGAIAFRSGNPHDGRELYVKAIDDFTNAGGKESDFFIFALAFIHLAYEEAVAGTPEAGEFYLTALGLSKKIKRADIDAMVARTAQALDRKAIPQTAPGSRKIILRVMSDTKESILA